LGSSTIQLKIFPFGHAKDLVMINLHDNEITSVTAAKELLEAHGGLLIKIENNNKRNIRVRLANHNYQFDPNRIFSREGIRRSLVKQSRISNAAINEIEKFAARILQLIPKIHPASLRCTIILKVNSLLLHICRAIKEKPMRKKYM
jgi:hypothetical protein